MLKSQHMAHVTSISQAAVHGQARPLSRPLTLHGTPLLTLAWLSLSVLAALGIANGGGGPWIVLLCLSLVCALKQSSNVAELSGVTLFFRDGIVGQYEQSISCRDIHTIWLRQNTLMRLFDVGHVGLTTHDGHTYWSPLIQRPGLLKNAVFEVAANRQPLWLPTHDQISLGDPF